MLFIRRTAYASGPLSTQSGGHFRAQVMTPGKACDPFSDDLALGGRWPTPEHTGHSRRGCGCGCEGDGDGDDDGFPGGDDGGPRFRLALHVPDPLHFQQIGPLAAALASQPGASEEREAAPCGTNRSMVVMARAGNYYTVASNRPSNT